MGMWVYKPLHGLISCLLFSTLSSIGIKKVIRFADGVFLSSKKMALRDKICVVWKVHQCLCIEERFVDGKWLD